MHPIVSTTLFISYVSALNSHLLDLQPLITPSPQVQVRDVAQSICGYYSTNGLGMMNGLLSQVLRKAEK